MPVMLFLTLSLVSAAFASPQNTKQHTKNDQAQNVELTVPAGVPLRLYLTKRIPKRANAPVEAKLLTPIYAFDHEVIPAGTLVLGHVSRGQSVPRWERIRAILGGDLTPLRVAHIQFTSLVPADGNPIALDTIESPGLNSLVPLKPAKQQISNVPGNKGGILDAGKQKAKDAINGQVARIKSIPD